MKIQSWFLHENFNQNERQVIECSLSGDEAKIKRETEKAALVEFQSDYGTICSWIPKTCIENEKPEVENLITLNNGQTVQTRDGKILTVIEIGNFTAKLSNKKEYVISSLKII